MTLLAINWSEVGIKAGQFVLSFSIIVILHELGHFIPARLFKCRVEKFYLFFNPWFSLWKKKIGETEWGIGWIPFGGYVKISGMIDESMDKEQLKQPAQPWEFRAKPAWQRLIIMVGGVFINLVLGFLIYAMMLWHWGEEYIPTNKMTYGIAADSLAQSVGFKDGDKVVSADGEYIEDSFLPFEICNYEKLIPEEEPAVSDALRQYLEEEGIKIKTGVRIKRIYQNQGEKIIAGTINGREFEARGEELLLATGRAPNTNLLGLETVRASVRKDGAVKVDREMHTTAPHVWAAGDVIGEPMLETIAAKEGATAAENALSGTHKKIDFLPVPRAIFTSPQVASVGLTEKGAHERGYNCACRTIPMSKVPKAIVIRDTRGLIKMVAEASTGRTLGVHILADGAADIIHEAVLAVKYRLTIDDIVDTVHVFPTMTESIKLAATSFRKDIDELSCCAE